MELENIRSLRKILIQSEKSPKCQNNLIETEMGKWEMRALYFPTFYIWNHTPRYHSANHNLFGFGLI